MPPVKEDADKKPEAWSFDCQQIELVDDGVINELAASPAASASPAPPGGPEAPGLHG